MPVNVLWRLEQRNYPNNKWNQRLDIDVDLSMVREIHGTTLVHAPGVYQFAAILIM
jgi:hypothetical protein